MRQIRQITLALLFSLLAFGQATAIEADELEFYSVSYTVSLSSTAGAISIQAPAGNSRRVYLKSAMVYCSVACTVSQDRNGTAASGTLLSGVVRLNGDTSTPAVKVYAPSNAGTGSSLPSIVLAAGERLPLDLSYSTFGRGSPGAQNYNIRTNAITGTLHVSLVWGERP